MGALFSWTQHAPRPIRELDPYGTTSLPPDVLREQNLLSTYNPLAASFGAPPKLGPLLAAIHVPATALARTAADLYGTWVLELTTLHKLHRKLLATYATAHALPLGPRPRTAPTDSPSDTTANPSPDTVTSSPAQCPPPPPPPPTQPPPPLFASHPVFLAQLPSSPQATNAPPPPARRSTCCPAAAPAPCTRSPPPAGRTAWVHRTPPRAHPGRP